MASKQNLLRWYNLDKISNKSKYTLYWINFEKTRLTIKKLLTLKT